MKCPSPYLVMTLILLLSTIVYVGGRYNIVERSLWLCFGDPAVNALSRLEMKKSDYYFYSGPAGRVTGGNQSPAEESWCGILEDSGYSECRREKLGMCSRNREFCCTPGHLYSVGYKNMTYYLCDV